ncbi:hypothetical protein JMA_36620 [Jeotgalibacillus malaysiensis]|uniref:Uncharacterized protein n=1 Tax=Jeotgalibacillus malaysiensis TaxID=1508404 RepID=A0A0B5AYB2_9BACL|nr:hypothetical protein JMA_36620 [Jeotgalibacillus malaysiensis]
MREMGDLPHFLIAAYDSRTCLLELAIEKRKALAQLRQA